MTITICAHITCGQPVDPDEANWDSGSPMHEGCANPGVCADCGDGIEGQPVRDSAGRNHCGPCAFAFDVKEN